MSLDYDDGYLEEDEDWLYIEDDYGLADELAESQIPDPGWPGTTYEIEAESYEFDLFDYWNDLDYADDAYWEETSVHPMPRVGPKRRRTASKRQNSLISRDKEPVIFLSREARRLLAEQNVAPPPNHPPNTLFVDWETRFRDEPHLHLPKASPAEIQNATEGAKGPAAFAEAEEWEDEDEEFEGGEEVDLDLESLQPILRNILRDKLGAAGLEDANLDSFMQSIAKAISGAGDADEAAGDLANDLLGRLTDGTGCDPLHDWLSGQGVPLEASHDDSAGIATADPPEDTASSIPTRLHSGSKEHSTKRQRSSPEPDSDLFTKRKRVAFDLPASSGSSLLQSQEQRAFSPPGAVEESAIDRANCTSSHDEPSSARPQQLRVFNSRKHQPDDLTSVIGTKRTRRPPG